MNKTIIFSLLTSLLLSSCLSMKPVQFLRTENFSVTSNNNTPVLNFSIVFHNPNSFGCSITNLESEGTVNNRLLFNAGVASKVRAKKKSDFSFPVTARLAKMDLNQLLGSGINLLLNNEAIPMQVKGEFRMKKFIFSKTYKFDYTQRIDKAQLMKLF